MQGVGKVGADGSFEISHKLAEELGTDKPLDIVVKLFRDEARTQQVGFASSITVGELNEVAGEEGKNINTEETNGESQASQEKGEGENPRTTMADEKVEGTIPDSSNQSKEEELKGLRETDEEKGEGQGGTVVPIDTSKLRDEGPKNTNQVVDHKRGKEGEDSGEESDHRSTSPDTGATERSQEADPINASETETRGEDKQEATGQSLEPPSLKDETANKAKRQDKEIEPVDRSEKNETSDEVTDIDDETTSDFSDKQSKHIEHHTVSGANVKRRKSQEQQRAKGRRWCLAATQPVAQAKAATQPVAKAMVPCLPA